MQWFLLASNAERGAALIDQITRLASGRGVGMVNRTDEYGNSAFYITRSSLANRNWQRGCCDIRHSTGRSAEQAAEFLSRLEQGVISSSNWDEANKALALVEKAVRDAWPEDEGEKGAPQAILSDPSRKATQAQSARKHVPRWETDPEERKAEWFRLARGKDGGKEVRRQLPVCWRSSLAFSATSTHRAKMQRTMRARQASGRLQHGCAACMRMVLQMPLSLLARKLPMQSFVQDFRVLASISAASTKLTNSSEQLPKLVCLTNSMQSGQPATARSSKTGP